MPGFDRTGPEGKGSRTGRAMGKCNPKSSQTKANEDVENLEKERKSGRGLRRGAGERTGKGQGRGRQ